MGWQLKGDQEGNQSSEPRIPGEGGQAVKGLKECIFQSPPSQSELGWDGGGGRRKGTSAEQREVERVSGRVVAMPGQMPMKNRTRKNRRGGEKGGGSWVMDPVASRDGHRAGRGWRGEGLKLGRMM